mmetsp:Transcript_76000/g.219481  ORF Transcript_76000/g.219481 Transcript_76000/m.219481 type:complete len:252 (+) Transcript_76000:226-981(+)
MLAGEATRGTRSRAPLPALPTAFASACSAFSGRSGAERVAPIECLGAASGSCLAAAAAASAPRRRACTCSRRATSSVSCRCMRYSALPKTSLTWPAAGASGSHGAPPKAFSAAVPRASAAQTSPLRIVSKPPGEPSAEAMASSGGCSATLAGESRPAATAHLAAAVSMQALPKCADDAVSASESLASASKQTLVDELPPPPPCSKARGVEGRSNPMLPDAFFVIVLNSMPRCAVDGGAGTWRRGADAAREI